MVGIELARTNDSTIQTDTGIEGSQSAATLSRTDVTHHRSSDIDTDCGGE